MNYIVAM